MSSLGKSDAQRIARRVRKGKHADLREEKEAITPYLADLHIPAHTKFRTDPGSEFTIATYNVHKWGGRTGGRTFNPKKAVRVLRELNADVLALQEVLRPFETSDPLIEIATELGYTMAFVCTRMHRRGELGNAILAKWPVSAAFAIDLSFGRLEQRAALAVQLRGQWSSFTVVATHLAIVDSTRKQQVQYLLAHPQIAKGPVILLGDMNAWRESAAAKHLDKEFLALHHNMNWPSTYPSIRPVMSLDRVYTRGATLENLRAHSSPLSKKGSDHLPVVANVVLNTD